MAWSSKDAATVPKGATAFWWRRLLNRFVAQHYEKDCGQWRIVAEIGFYHLLSTPLRAGATKAS